MDSAVPAFSIGITTYDRKHLLGQTLASLLAQSFRDFEVIVGNDNPDEPFDTSELGVTDSRVRIVNHPRNLGELENMNSLLSLARGRYFSWLADDDLYAPNLLEVIHDALARHGFPACAFSSYRLVFETPPIASVPVPKGAIQIMDGTEFLRRYLSGGLRAIGVGGFFDTAVLRTMGGLEGVASGKIALCAEYLLIIKAGALPRIAYVDSPLLQYRVHDASWGSTSADMDISASAGLTLVKRGTALLGEPIFQHREECVMGLLKLAAGHFIMTAFRNSPVPLKRIWTHVGDISRAAGRPHIPAGLVCWLPWPFCKACFSWRRRRQVLEYLRRLRPCWHARVSGA